MNAAMKNAIDPRATLTEVIVHWASIRGATVLRPWIAGRYS